VTQVPVNLRNTGLDRQFLIGCAKRRV